MFINIFQEPTSVSLIYFLISPTSFSTSNFEGIKEIEITQILKELKK